MSERAAEGLIGGVRNAREERERERGRKGRDK